MHCHLLLALKRVRSIFGENNICDIINFSNTLRYRLHEQWLSLLQLLKESNICSKEAMNQCKIRCKKWSKEIKSDICSYCKDERVITLQGVIKKIPILLLQYWPNKIILCTKIISHFGCTNIIFSPALKRVRRMIKI